MVFTLTYTIRDTDADRSTMRINVPADTTLTDLTTFSDTFAGLLDDVTEGVIEDVAVSFALGLPAGLKTSSQDCDVEHGALFSFSTDGGFSTSFRLPAIKTSKLTGKQVTTGDTDVAALVAAVVTGSGGVAPCDRRGEAILSLISAVESFRR